MSTAQIPSTPHQPLVDHIQTSYQEVIPHSSVAQVHPSSSSNDFSSRWQENTGQVTAKDNTPWRWKISSHQYEAN
ncbi:MAG: hypothetical protein ACOYK6_05415 [Chthoniobacterales bacterium]